MCSFLPKMRLPCHLDEVWFQKHMISICLLFHFQIDVSRRSPLEQERLLERVRMSVNYLGDVVQLVHRAGTHFNLSSNALCDLERQSKQARLPSHIVVPHRRCKEPTPIANSTTADFPLDVPQFCGFHSFSLDASWHNNWFRCKLNTLHFKRSAQIKRACLWPHNERDFKLHRGSNP